MTLLLPRITFLAGPPTQCRELASIIAEADSEAMPCSFRTPILSACRAIFYEEDPSINLLAETELPIVKEPVADFLHNLETMLRNHYGPTLLGQIMLRSIEENSNYFDRFVLIDGIYTDMEEIANNLGRQNCLLIDLSPNPPTQVGPAGVRYLGYIEQPNASPLERLELLTSLLAQP